MKEPILDSPSSQGSYLEVEMPGIFSSDRQDTDTSGQVYMSASSDSSFEVWNCEENSDQQIQDLICECKGELLRFTLPGTKLETLGRSFIVKVVLSYLAIWVLVMVAFAVSLSMNHNTKNVLIVQGVVAILSSILLMFLCLTFVPRLLVRKLNGWRVTMSQICIAIIVLYFNITPISGLWALARSWRYYSTILPETSVENRTNPLDEIEVSSRRLIEHTQHTHEPEFSRFVNAAVLGGICLLLLFWSVFARLCWEFTRRLVETTHILRTAEEVKRGPRSRKIQDDCSVASSEDMAMNNTFGMCISYYLLCCGLCRTRSKFYSAIERLGVRWSLSSWFVGALLLYVTLFVFSSWQYTYYPSIIPFTGLVTLIRVCGSQDANNVGMCSSGNSTLILSRVISVLLLAALEGIIFFGVSFQVKRTLKMLRHSPYMRNRSNCLGLAFIHTSFVLLWTCVYALALVDVCASPLNKWVQSSPSGAENEGTDPLYHVGVTVNSLSFEFITLLVCTWIFMVAFMLLPPDSRGFKGWWASDKASHLFKMRAPGDDGITVDGKRIVDDSGQICVSNEALKSSIVKGNHMHEYMVDELPDNEAIDHELLRRLHATYPMYLELESDADSVFISTDGALAQDIFGLQGRQQMANDFFLESTEDIPIAEGIEMTDSDAVSRMKPVRKGLPTTSLGGAVTVRLAASKWLKKGLKKGVQREAALPSAGARTSEQCAAIVNQSKANSRMLQTRANVLVFESEVRLLNFAACIYLLGKRDSPRSRSEEQNMIGDPKFRIVKHIIDSKTDMDVLIAVKSDLIVVVFRGNDSKINDETELDVDLVPWKIVEHVNPLVLNGNAASLSSQRPCVHQGFLQAYNTVKCQIRNAVTTFLFSCKMTSGKVVQCQKRPVCCTGHGIGGAFATIAALDLACFVARRVEGTLPAISCTTFGSPKVGNDSFVARYRRLVPRTHRFVLTTDLTPSTPAFSPYVHTVPPLLMDPLGHVSISPFFAESFFVLGQAPTSSAKKLGVNEYVVATMLWASIENHKADIWRCIRQHISQTVFDNPTNEVDVIMDQNRLLLLQADENDRKRRMVEVEVVAQEDVMGDTTTGDMITPGFRNYFPKNLSPSNHEGAQVGANLGNLDNFIKEENNTNSGMGISAHGQSTQKDEGDLKRSKETSQLENGAIPCKAQVDERDHPSTDPVNSGTARSENSTPISSLKIVTESHHDLTDSIDSHVHDRTDSIDSQTIRLRDGTLVSNLIKKSEKGSQ
mmetsp:Transcript_11239/g.20882  ORF Transcript_11239/g.20882 Transcript_11239/m.20882 type:complete len:1252 (-) Transcript_11239:208-3963(-)